MKAKLVKLGTRALWLGKKYLPHILVGTGIAGGIGAGFMVRKAARLEIQAECVAEDKQLELDAKAEGNAAGVIEYPEETHALDSKGVRKEFMVACVKAYAPAVTVAVLSTASILAGFNVINKRYLLLGTMYTSLQTEYSRYRHNVRMIHGDEVDKTLAGMTEKATIDPETGEVIIPKSEFGGSIYAARFAADTTPYWRMDPVANYLFVRAQQAAMNDTLQARGHLVLNDVYEHLGLPHTPEGAVVGWVKDMGDGYLDFNLPEDGYETMDELVLDFNVQGVMWDLIKKRV